MMKKILLGLCAMAVFSAPAYSSVRIDVKNDTSEDCSLAINVRTDKTKWQTIGWYVYASGEEAPIIIDNISDIRSVYVYNDCQRQIPEGAETKKVWVKTNLQFNDESPKDNELGYEEVTFVRLTSDKYVIQSQ